MMQPHLVQPVIPAVDVTLQNLDLSVNNNVVLTVHLLPPGTTLKMLLGIQHPQTAINSFVSGAVVKSVKAQVRPCCRYMLNFCMGGN
ncbi:MAG: hypothetical protein H7A09_06985 [Oceanospirillaceae bacterium]|nr:hypothetical protein [Oceanospirillaceae bacterium]